MSVALAEFEDVNLTLPSRAGPVDILRGVSLDIKSGEAIGIVGPSGSGKTTLLMVMGGLEYATSGRVHVVGENLSDLDEDDLARLRGQHIGIVFQSFHLIPTMTAWENVALPLEFLGKNDPFEIAEAALTDVGLSNRLDHFPAQLSGGEQQRVALARALSPRPKLLLADEPTGNLDARTGAQVMDLMFELQDRHGATLVLVTHDQALTARCKRIVRMQDGKIVAPADGNGATAGLSS
ncbi:MAG: ABC transporter ATP-binding protein [Methyloligellaceae bacterium]